MPNALFVEIVALRRHHLQHVLFPGRAPGTLPGMIETGLLATYLNDHLAGATAGVELVKRARGENEGTPLGRFLEGLAREIEEDRETLLAVMARLDVGRDRVKVAAGWLGEKVGRLKPNNRLFGYSPLSRLIELEGLAFGVEGKRSLWEVLRHLEEPRLAEFDFDALLERARAQRDALQERRLAAALDAFKRD
jgi:hypothetical protein